MIMFVHLDAFVCILQIEALVLERHEYPAIYWNYVVGQADSFDWTLLNDVLPDVVAYLLNGESFSGVGVQNALQDVFALETDVFGAGLVPRQNLFLKVGRVGVFERELAANHCEEDDPTRPNVDLDATLPLPFHHFGRSIAWTPAGRFK